MMRGGGIFTHRYNIGDRTLIEGVKRLGPGSRLIFQRGKLSITRWGSLRFGADKSRSFAEAVEGAAEYLKAAVLRRLIPDRRLVLTLSGGLDSRAMVCAIPRDARPLPVITWGAEGSREMAIAKQVAERCGFDLICTDPAAVPLSSIAPLAAWRTEGEVSLRHTMSVVNHSAIRRAGDFVGGGWLGELTKGKYIAPFMLCPASSETFISRCYSYGFSARMSSLRRIFSEDFLQETIGPLKDAYLESWGSIGGETNIDRWLLWYLENKALRTTNATMPVDSHILEKFRPFYDRAYLEFAIGSPWRFLVGGMFYKAMIFQLGPELRGVPDSRYDQLLYGTRYRNAFNYLLELTSRATSRAKGYLSSRNELSMTQRSGTDSGIEITSMIRADQSLRRSLERFLNGPDCDDSLFNVPGIRSLVQEHYDGSADVSRFILQFSTVHRALEYFVYHPVSEPPADLS